MPKASRKTDVPHIVCTTEELTLLTQKYVTRTDHKRRYLGTGRGLLLRIPTKAILDGLKRNMSRGNPLSDELELSSVLGDARAYLYSPVLG